MADDDGGSLSRRLHWDADHPAADAGESANPEDTRAAPVVREWGSREERWDDELGAVEVKTTEVRVPGGPRAGAAAGPSFERRELSRMDDEALDRRRQLWRDTAIILSSVVVALLIANLVFP